jgi:hypothetical protein
LGTTDWLLGREKRHGKGRRIDMNDDKRTVESASVALADDLRFTGDIDGFHIDLDAEEGVGGQGAGTQPLRLLLLGVADARRWT